MVTMVTMVTVQRLLGINMWFKNVYISLMDNYAVATDGANFFNSGGSQSLTVQNKSKKLKFK